ncbi:hypothetical protein [Nitrosomonas sp. Nm33]|uniref:hypothetical protein n=1 Tax=Nitrosomonas sp. Nm33 TaxID=133724 RepID=UPI0008976E76|nr:hypothetical protein [Nitrosomonas sp. Nm33]SDY52667.1 hypothetical protein SAMN05421755_102738 [Nitrosomonas sp. Nm33]
MKQPVWAGIDVAKRKFDIALLINNKIRTKVFGNTPAGYKAFTDWLSERGTIFNTCNSKQYLTPSYFFGAITIVPYACGFQQVGGSGFFI